MLQARHSLSGLRLAFGGIIACWASVPPCGIGMVGYSCRFILELCNFFLFLLFSRHSQLRVYLKSEIRLWTLNSVGIVGEHGDF